MKFIFIIFLILPFLNKINSKIPSIISKIISQSSINLSKIQIKPSYAYNVLTGYDKNRKILNINSEKIFQNENQAIQQFYLREKYDEVTIGKILENIKKIDVSELQIKSPLVFTEAESFALDSKGKEFWADKKRDFVNNNIFVDKTQKNNKVITKLGEIEKIPIFIPIPIFNTYEVPKIEHYEYKQNIREIMPVKVEISVEHKVVNSIPYNITRIEKIIIPQAVPDGVNIPFKA